MSSVLMLCDQCSIVLALRVGDRYLVGNLILKEIKGMCSCGEPFELQPIEKVEDDTRQD